MIPNMMMETFPQFTGTIIRVYLEHGMFGELILIKYYDFLLCPVTRVVPHRHEAGHAGSHG